MFRPRDVYHRLVSPETRERMAHLRRRVADKAFRLRRPEPIPPAPLLARIQGSTLAREYAGIGTRAAASIAVALRTAGLTPAAARLLDFGCGSARIAGYLVRDGWDINGCDPDPEAIAWATAHIPQGRFTVTGESPPLPFSDGSFDALLAIAVLSHMDPASQRSWADEFARVVRPGGALVVSAVGESVAATLPAPLASSLSGMLAAGGSAWVAGEHGFASAVAAHRVDALVALFPSFSLMRWEERGLDGCHDLYLFIRRRTDARHV
jgi:SAM-dependent methyltransferase